MHMIDKNENSMKVDQTSGDMRGGQLWATLIPTGTVRRTCKSMFWVQPMATHGPVFLLGLLMERFVLSQGEVASRRWPQTSCMPSPLMVQVESLGATADHRPALWRKKSSGEPQSPLPLIKKINSCFGILFFWPIGPLPTHIHCLVSLIIHFHYHDLLHFPMLLQILTQAHHRADRGRRSMNKSQKHKQISL